MADPSVPAVEMVDVALRSYFQAPASEPKLTNPDEVHEANRGLKVGKTWPKQYTERSLEAHSPASGIPPGPDLQRNPPHPPLPSLVEARSVTSILKPGKGLALPSSYRPISLLDSIGKLFEKILLARILREVSEIGLMRDEHVLAAGPPR